MLILIDMTGENEILLDAEEKNEKENIFNEMEEARYLPELQILQVPNI